MLSLCSAGEGEDNDCAFPAPEGQDEAVWVELLQDTGVLDAHGLPSPGGLLTGTGAQGSTRYS